MGAAINARMGLNTWAAFFGSDANAEIAGDVAMLAGEVTPVLKALRANGLNVVAIHNHMTADSQPSISSILGRRSCREAGDRIQGGPERTRQPRVSQQRPLAGAKRQPARHCIRE